MLNLKALTLAVVVGVLSPVLSMNVLNVPQVLAQTPDERKAEADRLLQQGDQQLASGQYQAALQSFQQAFLLSREISYTEGIIAATVQIANAYAYLGETEKASELFELFLKVAQETNNSELEKLARHNLQLLENLRNPKKVEADRLFQQGLQQHKTSQFREALQSFQQALKIYQEIGDRFGEGSSLNNLGNAYHSLGQYHQAIDFHQQSLTIAREIGDRDGEAASLGNLGNAYYSLGQYHQAIKFDQQSLTINREIGDRNGEAGSLGNLGNTYNSLGQYQQAIEFHQQSLAIKREIGDRNGEAGSLGNLGNTYNSLGQYQQAIEFIEQSLAISREIGDRRGEANSLGSLGNAYLFLGQYHQAIEFLQQWLTIAREIGDRNGEGTSLGNLGSAYFSLGQYQKAIEYHQQSLAIAREIGDRNGEARSLGNLGGAYEILGQYQKAIEFHQQSLVIFREIGDRLGESRSLGGLGGAYRNLGQYQKAIEFHQQHLTIAREIGDRLGESRSLGGLGNVYFSLGQYQKAIEYLQQQLTIAREIGDRNGEALSLNNLGAALLNLDKPAEAEVELRKAIDVYESLRIDLEQDSDKVSIFDTYLDSFRSLQMALIAQNKTDAALEISEKGRARSLIELMSERLNDGQPGLVPTAEPLNIEQIQQIAKNKNSTFVQYSIIRSQDDDISSLLYIWVVQPTTGEVTFKEVNLLSLNTPLREIVDNSRIDIGARGRNGDGDFAVRLSPQTQQERLAKQTANLRQLHDLLIQPIADLLPTDPSEKVVFMPQGELYLVPFPALMDEQNQYLIEKHTILTSPSIQLLDVARQSHTEKQNNPASEVLIVGNPTMPEVWNPNSDQMEQLSALQGAEDEAFAIAEKFQVKPLVWGEATESIVTQKMRNARLIHLATHGLLEYGIPEESGVLDAPGAIALAPSADADGLLTSLEIYNMKLNAELVVLSACDTGRGKISGDGVIGLSRAFLQAGVPSLIVSLWKVPDDSTQFLMTKFYEYWTGDTDKIVALRRAILETKEKYPEPINWAAFTLVGEAQ
ncbi:CHAT domain-containing protein [Capilliphycus salinus ALCB114379]|uniref:CHAT domain-containing protein n=1 Tax=Capilliphycus salinus TaxID=2768948 RepID=UPI0039A77738